MFGGEHRQRTDFYIPVGVLHDLELAHLIDFLNPFPNVNLQATMKGCLPWPKTRKGTRRIHHPASDHGQQRLNGADLVLGYR
jgi:hypothetical protein